MEENIKKEEVLEKIKEVTNFWSNYGKERYYFSTRYARKENAFFSKIKEKNQRYTWELENNQGFIHANKVYNGCVTDELKEIGLNLGELV